MAIEVFEHIKELAPFKFEFIDENDNYYKLDSYVKSVQDDYILISPPDNKGASVKIQDNAQANLIFTLGNGVLVAQCGVIGKELSANSGIKVSYPYSTKIMERREYIRVPMKLKVEVFCYPDKNNHPKSHVNGITKNISGSGISFYHKEPLGDCYEVACKIHLNDGNHHPVETKDDVIYSQKVLLKNEHYYLTALTHTHISELDLSRVIKECFKYQIRHKHTKH